MQRPLDESITLYQVQDMCNLGTAIENKGRNEGIAIGEKRGIDIGEFKTTVKYCRRRVISIKQAAKDLNMTVEEFTQKMNQLPKEVINA